MNPVRKKDSFYGEELLAHRQPPSQRLTYCRLSATAYSIYSQLRRIFRPKGEDVRDEWIN